VAVTYKGIKDRQRWLQPWEKFKPKAVKPVEAIPVEIEEVVEEVTEAVIESETAEEPVEEIIVEGILIEEPRHRGRKKKVEKVAEDFFAEEPQDVTGDDPWAV